MDLEELIAQAYTFNNLPHSVHVHDISNKEMASFNKVFMFKGLVVPVPVETVDAIDKDKIRLYCHKKGIYGIITDELIDYINVQFFSEGTQNVIAVGSGLGTLGRALGIPVTDSRLQETPEMRAMYAISGQPVIRYPSDIQTLEVIQAIAKYKPTTIVGSWCTQIYRKGDEEEEIGSNMYGFDFYKILNRTTVTRIILYGTETIHGLFRIVNDPDYKVIRHKGDFMRSRTADNNNNTIFVITKK